MLSDAPHASWHPAMMPNSLAELPRTTSKDIPAFAPVDDAPTSSAALETEAPAADNAVEEEIHDRDQSIGANQLSPDHGISNGWVDDDAIKPHAGTEPAPVDKAPTASDSPNSESTNNATKHFSTSSFTRTVPHEVNWNDDDDAEWNLPRTETDPFKFMPPSDRTNSFPPVPPQPEPEPAHEELPQPLSPNQAHAVLHEAEEDDGHQPAEAGNADPEVFGASFNDDGDGEDFFHQTAGGELSGTQEEAMEARFEEGIPLIQPTEEVSPPSPHDEDAGTGLFGGDDAAEEDDFFSKSQGNPQPEEPVLALERKSTMQVLGGLDVGSTDPNVVPLEETAEEAADAPETSDEEVTAAPTAPAEQQDKPTEDLDEKWKAMFGDDDEDDGFLPDDDEGLLPDDDTGPEGVDVTGFLGLDDEGFLDEAQAPAPIPASAPSIPQSPSQLVNGRYLPPSAAPASSARPANPYLPAVATTIPPVAAGNPYFAAATTPVLPSPTSPHFAAPSPGFAPPKYGASPLPPAQEQTKPQSFVDKAKGGYTSPYDLPMEVVKPKLRQPTQHPLRSSSTPNVPPLAPPAPLRSASLASPPGPPKVPHPAAAATVKPPPTEKFFEELPIAPITAKPRSASRQSHHGVPTPPQASPYAPPPQQGPYAVPPHAGPPMPPHSASPHQPPPPAQADAEIPRLVAPPRLDPYAQVQAGSVPSPSIPSATTSRYSPAPASAPSANGAVPVPATTRYSPAPPAARPPVAAYGSHPPISAPPVLPHQPRTSSPLAHFEISHERSRASAAVNNHEGGSLAEKRSVSSLHSSHLQRVPSLPPTTEVEEEDGPAYAQTPTGHVASPPLLSPEYRHHQVTHRPRQTPPPSAYPLQSALSPPKRAMSSHGMPPGPQEFAPPPRSQTQSPGKLYGPRNGNVVEPAPRPSSAQGHPVHNPTVVAAPTAAPTRPRAPSHSLNLVAPTDGRERDPLQRWKGAPLLTWGVGGTMVTMFPKDVPRYGINNTVPMIVRSPGEVKVQNFRDVQPLEERLTKFPGPLKGKAKKKETVAWLTAGIESLEREQPHNLHAQLQQSHDDKRLAERVLLWKILRVFVEHDGMLEGTPAADQAVRAVLSPQLETPEGGPSYITGADVGRLKESPVTRMQSDMVDASTVEQIRRHLLNGESEKAIWAAADVRLWGHALLLANALAPNLYKQVAQEFVKKEVNFPGHNNESLAALYGVLSGNHEESVDELVPVHARAGLQLVAKNSAAGPSKDAVDGLDKWRETLSLILSNRSVGDVHAISSLGNLLAGYGRAEAAHICYMFARSDAVFDGLDNPMSNFVLVGSDHKRQTEQFAKEIEPLLLSEVYEYGQSLAGGSNVVLTSPHLAAYKLQHAFALAEYGYRDKAIQYCEAILEAITAQTKRSPYYHAVLGGAVEDLMKRLKQAPKEESNSWIPKPSMNKVSDSVWNRFNKFVAGDDNENAQASSNEEAAGPFARVAGGTPTISRTPSVSGLETFGATVPSYGVPPPLTNGPIAASAPSTRAASRYAPAPGQPAHATQNSNPYEPGSPYAPRSSMERTSAELTRTSSDLRRQSSESQRGRPSLYNPNQATSPVTGYMPFGAGPAPVSQPPVPAPPPAQPVSSGYEPYGYSATANNGVSSEPVQSSEDTNGNSGYQAPSYGYEPPSYSPYEAPQEAQNGGAEAGAGTSSFEAPSFQPYGYEAPSYEPDQPSNEKEELDEEPKPKPKKKGIMYDDDDDFPMPAVKPQEKTKEEKDKENAELFRKAAEEDAKRAAEAKAAKKGWGFGSWFGGGAAKETIDAAAPNKPIRAKLGDKNSFYYDPEQKRWVNKNADPKDQQAKVSTPPPPKAAPRSVSSTPAPPMAGPPMAGLDAGRASAPPMAPPRSTMTPPPAGPSPTTDVNSLGPPPMMRSVSNTSSASAPPSRPPTSLSNSSSIDDLLSAAGPRKGAKKPRKSARYVDIMTKE